MVYGTPPPPPPQPRTALGEYLPPFLEPVALHETIVEYTDPLGVELDSKLDAAEKGVASGVAPLDASSKLLETNIPARLSDAALGTAYASPAAVTAAVAPKLDSATAATTYIPLADKGVNSGVATLDSAGVAAQTPKIHASRHVQSGADPILNVPRVVNVVTDYGAKGDGSTDDSAAIQAALNYAGPKGYSVYFPAPATGAYYKVLSTITVSNWYGLRVYGDGWETTEIRSFIGNGPLFSFTVDNTHSQTFEKLRITTSAVQTYAAAPNSIAFARTNVDGVSSLSGHYHHAYRDLKIIGFTYGFRVYRAFGGDTTSTNPWWGCEWTRVFFSNINRSCVSLNLGTVGAPCNRFDQVKVFQNQPNKNDGGAAAFELRGEAVMTAIDVEQWHNQVINMPSGNYLNINGLHIEHHYVDDASGGNRAVYVANVPATISSFFVSYDSTDAFAKYAIYADTNSHVIVNGAYLYSPSGGASYLFATPATANAAKLSARAVNVTGFGSGVGLWTNGSLAITSIYEIEGQPPVLQSTDALPTAAVAYRNRRYIQLGNGTTTADQVVQCMLSAAGTYSWKTVVTG